MASAPVWASLHEPGGPHWKALSRDYAPVGLLELIRTPPKTVLDVGCFCGATGAWLKAKYPGCRVVGVEPVEQAAREARAKLDVVLHAKLEDANLASAGIAGGTVDAIVLADVLEHMFDPWQALNFLRPLLKPGGVVLASIPNIRNIALLETLCRGDFPYAESGLLDITHIRFFTGASIRRMMEETGYRIEEMISNIDPACRSLLDGLGQSPTINIDSDYLQLKNVAPNEVVELATLQFFIRAGVA